MGQRGQNAKGTKPQGYQAHRGTTIAQAHAPQGAQRPRESDHQRTVTTLTCEEVSTVVTTTFTPGRPVSQDTWRAVPAIPARNPSFPESGTTATQPCLTPRRGKIGFADGLLRPDPRASTSRTQHGISLPPVSPVTPRTPLARISPSFRVSLNGTIKRSPDGYGKSIMEDKERR